MKIVCFLLVILAASDSDWRTEIDASIAAIDAVTVPKYEKTSYEEKDTLTICRYKLGDLEKRTFVFETTGFFGSGSFTYYAKADFIFAQKVVSIGEYLRKGVAKDGDPTGSIHERNWYFQNDHAGVSESRFIEYFTNSNKDSLRIVLQQQPFETDSIGNKEYLQAERGYQRSKKNHSGKH